MTVTIDDRSTILAAVDLGTLFTELGLSQGRNKQWPCPNPTHAQTGDTPPVNISLKDGHGVFHCHGCELSGSAIDLLTTAKGLTAAEAFAELRQRAGLPPVELNGQHNVEDLIAKPPRIAATYDYTDEAGNLLFQVCRMDPKGFRQRRPDGNGGWTWNLSDTRRVLYRLPDVLEAAHAGNHIFVVEGEKDVHTLEAVDLVATTNPGGAGKWHDAYTEAVKGAVVTIWADDDAPGHAHAFKVRAALHSAGIIADVIRSTKAKDATDHFAGDYGRDDIETLVDPDVDELDHTDWDPIDLGPALRGELELPEPTILRRDDHKALFYASRVNGIFGDSGLGKSMVYAVIAAQEIRAGHHVALIDFEDPNETTIVTRLRMLGLSSDQILTFFHYFNPKTEADDTAIAKVCAVIDHHHITVVAIDSLGEAFGLEGLNEDKDVEVGPWLRRVPRHIADTTGTAVIIIDHATKALDGSLHPSGSKRKRAAVTGAQYLVTAPRPLDKEHGGRLTLTVAKDRHGNHQRGQPACSIEFTVYPDEGTTWHVWPPMPASEGDDDPTRELRWVAKIAAETVQHLTTESGAPPSQNTVIEAMSGSVKGRRTTLIAGLDLAVATGALRTEDGPRRALLFHFIRPYLLTTGDE